MAWDESKRRWQRWAKHLPLPNHPWQQQVAWTRGDAARYSPDLPIPIEQLEMDCVTFGVELPPDVRPNVRRYYRDMGYVVGASEGELTTIVYAEWCSTGEVHGHPVTVRDLRKKGMT
jgi:hypothetical protein